MIIYYLHDELNNVLLCVEAPEEHVNEFEKYTGIKRIGCDDFLENGNLVTWLPDYYKLDQVDISLQAFYGINEFNII